MGPLEELRLHVEALATATDANPKFFASVRHYVAQLRQLLLGPHAPSRDELQLLVSKVGEFWGQWRPSGDGFYIPPRETADTDSTVQRMRELVGELERVDESSFQEMVTRLFGSLTSSHREAKRTVPQPCVFIGHGRSRLWARVKTYLEDELGLATVTYESESRTGDSIVPVLEKMLEQATFAVLLLTAEDSSQAGGRRARQNVIHEAGLFQGKLGFRRAVLLVQEGVEEFSNVAGLQHIPLSGENVEQTFYELQRVLKREKQLAQSHAG
jgi:predicted nucleotide-binding protein